MLQEKNSVKTQSRQFAYSTTIIRRLIVRQFPACCAMMKPMFFKIRTLYQTLRPHWRWYLRATIAWMILSNLTPAGPRAPLGAPQMVETVKPEVCVHTRLIDEVYEWKIQRSLQLIREMGANTIVEFFPWAYIEREKGHYDWASVDVIARH